jgi:hypothetical protein
MPPPASVLLHQISHLFPKNQQISILGIALDHFMIIGYVYKFVFIGFYPAIKSFLF